jgi:hypothetical protein
MPWSYPIFSVRRNLLKIFSPDFFSPGSSHCEKNSSQFNFFSPGSSHCEKDSSHGISKNQNKKKSRFRQKFFLKESEADWRASFLTRLSNDFKTF